MKIVVSVFFCLLLAGQPFSILATENVDTDSVGRSLARAPSAPANVRVDRYSTTVVELFWDAATDDQFIAAYRVTRNGTEVYFGNGHSYFDSQLDENRSYRYEIVSIDNEGNRGGAAVYMLHTGTASETQSSEPPVANAEDRSPPSEPGNLRLEPYSATSVELFWNASVDDNGVAGYDIIRNGQSQGVRDVLSYYEGWLQADRDYQYQVVAVDRSGNRSSAASVQRPATTGGTSGGAAPSNGTGFELQLTQSELSVVEGSDSTVTSIRLNRTGSTAPVRLSVRGESDGQMRNLSAWFDRDVLSDSQTSSQLYLQLFIGMAAAQFHQRHLIVSATDGTSTRELRLSLNITPVSAPDVYLLAGQSNMEGYSERGAKASWDGGADQPHSRIFQLNVQPNSLGVFYEDWLFTDEASNVGEPMFIVAEDPLHEPRGAGRESKEGSFIGLGLSFAKAALPNTTQDIYMVPAAWGASGFCRNSQRNLGWNAYQNGNANFSNTRLTDRALTRLNMVLRETGGILRGILWHQGEADSNDWECASRYSEHLTQLIHRLRNDARWDRRGAVARGADGQVPFILGTMSRGNEFAHFGEIKALVDSAHRNIATAVSYADFVNVDDLVPPSYPCGDGSCIHFGAGALREMGFRYYSALRRVNLGE